MKKNKKNFKRILSFVFVCLMMIITNKNSVFAIENAEDSIAISSTEIMEIYKRNEVEANEQFKDKLVNIDGKVHSVENSLYKTKISIKVSDNEFVVCNISSSEKKASKISKGQNISIEGICTGKLGNNLYINQCFIK